jgi:hypothetical protein
MSPVFRVRRGNIFRGKPHLVVRLKEGWRFDSKQSVFISAVGQTLSATKDLPKGSKVVYMSPGLSEADQGSLSEPERDLACYLQIIFPNREDPSAYLGIVKAWDCVAEVRLPPRVSLA